MNALLERWKSADERVKEKVLRMAVARMAILAKSEGPTTVVEETPIPKAVVSVRKEDIDDFLGEEEPVIPAIDTGKRPAEIVRPTVDCEHNDFASTQDTNVSTNSQQTIIQREIDADNQESLIQTHESPESHAGMIDPQLLAYDAEADTDTR